MSIKSLYPDIRPSLLLDFANAKQLDPRITFTRNSTATYVGRDGLIKTAGIGQPRFDHDQITGESLGLLIEESRTNQITRSEEIDNGAWNKLNLTATANQTTAPDGTTTADKIAKDSAATETVYINDDSSVTSGNAYTQSIFVKAAEYSYFQIAPSTGFPTGHQNFDLVNGVLGISDGTIDDASITAYPNGWYRCTLTVTSDTSSSGGRMVMGPTTSASAGRLDSVSGSIGDGIYVWGAQLEVGSFPTSYIPTSGSSATRSSETALINQQIASGDITICAEYKLRMTSSNEWNRLFGFGEGSSDIRPLVNGSGQINFFNYSTEFTVPWPVSQPDFDTPFKFAMAVRQGVANSVVIDGGSVNTQSNTNPGAYVNWNELYLGWADVGNSPRNSTGHIKYFRVYNDSLTDDQLQLLTS